MLLEPSSGSYRITYLPRRDVWGQSIGSSSSPVASGWSRSCSMMKRSIVMTEVDVCTLAISREGDSAYLVRSENLTAPTPQPAEHLGGRMAVMIVRAHADHGFARPQLAEPRVRRRAQ